MSIDLYLGIDQGSSATKGVLLSADGQVVWSHSVPVHSYAVRSSWVEQDPKLLLSSVERLLDDAFLEASRQEGVIRSIGLACQSSGVMAWETGSGKILHPLITHRDSRFRETIDELSGAGALVTRRSGVPLLPNYAAPKIAWLQRKFTTVSTRVGTLDTFLLDRLTRGGSFHTDETMAARSMLYNLESSRWDDELCGLFGVDMGRLPEVVPSFAQHGTYRDVPVAVCMRDQQASLFGQLRARGGSFLNLGTIASLTFASGETPVFLPGFVTSVFHSGLIPGRRSYLTEAVTPSCGPLLAYLARVLGIDPASGDLDRLCERAAASGDGAVGFFPVDGTGTPWWRSGLPYLLSGRVSDDRAEMARAAVECLGGFVASNLRILLDRGFLDRAEALRVGGGVSRSAYLLQFIADVSGVKLERVPDLQSTAGGIARAAAMAVGDEVPSDTATSAGEIFEPGIGISQTRFARWRTLCDRALLGKWIPNEIFLQEQVQAL